MSMNFDANTLIAKITSRLEGAVEVIATEIAISAARRAPVRKVFKGSAGGTRLQTDIEVAAEATERASMGLAPGAVMTQSSPASRIHDFGDLRRIGLEGRIPKGSPGGGRFARRLAHPVELTGRGRWELKSGRAIIKVGGQRFLGGKLKQSIKATGVTQSGAGTFIARVNVGVSYGKYVEFGTKHNRAQPFLRPAIASQREAFRSALAKAVGQ